MMDVDLAPAGWLASSRKNRRKMVSNPITREEGRHDASSQHGGQNMRGRGQSNHQS